MPRRSVSIKSTVNNVGSSFLRYLHSFPNDLIRSKLRFFYDQRQSCRLIRSPIRISVESKLSYNRDRKYSYYKKTVKEDFWLDGSLIYMTEWVAELTMCLTLWPVLLEDAGTEWDHCQRGNQKSFLDQMLWSFTSNVRSFWGSQWRYICASMLQNHGRFSRSSMNQIWIWLGRCKGSIYSLSTQCSERAEDDAGQWKTEEKQKWNGGIRRTGKDRRKIFYFVYVYVCVRDIGLICWECERCVIRANCRQVFSQTCREECVISGGGWFPPSHQMSACHARNAWHYHARPWWPFVPQRSSVRSAGISYLVRYDRCMKIPVRGYLSLISYE